MVHKARGVAEPPRRETQRLARERLRVAQAVWFHFACVGLAQAPRGEYICDACGAGFGFRRAYDDDEDSRAIACLQENPKKPGTACNLRYEAYKSATTVAEFLEKGGTPADLTHDVGKGFVWYLDADDGRRPRGNQPRE